MDIRGISKALAGSLATTIAGTGSAYVALPPGVDVPWWGYLLVGVVNAAIGFGVVYFAPANLPAAKPK